ncbi:hypothetical protein D3C87_2080630 [compost metagenome]
MDTGNAAGLVAGLIDRNGKIFLASQAGAVLESDDQAQSFKVLENVQPSMFAGIAQTTDSQVAIVGMSGVQVVGLR